MEAVEEEAGRMVKPWQERVMFVRSMSGTGTHSEECLMARPLRAPTLVLHPDMVQQVLRLLALKVPPAEILADNIRLLRDTYGSRTTMGEFRLLLDNQVRA